MEYTIKKRNVGFASVILFIFILAIVTWDTRSETTRDVDLGVAPSTLRFRDQVLWSAPLAAFITVPIMTGGLIVLKCYRMMRRKRSVIHRK